MMKIPILLLVLVTYSAAYAQTILDKRVSLQVNDLTLKKTLRAIERASGVKFVYSRNRLNLDERITLEVYHQKLGDVLDNLFNPRTIRHTLQPSNDYIVLSQPKDPYSDWPGTRENSRAGEEVLKITGDVKDSKGEPLPGVNVIIKGTTVGTSTDAQGRFTINIAKGNPLLFTYIGYKTIELPIIGSMVDVVMEDDVAALSQVVINAGYWQVEDRETTGNIIKVSEADIQKQPVNNSIQALIGRTPGVYVQQTTGVPGAPFKIFLRGVNTLPGEGNSNPLYIIDGVPFTSATLSLEALDDQIIANGTSPLNNINTLDIESIEILKDADATAIYGSRGAKGIILVTTKKGKPGKTTAEINLYQGVSDVTKRLSLLDTRRWLTMRREAFSNDNATPGSYDYDLNGTWDTTRNTDWQQKLAGKLVQSTNAYASLTGGNENTSFIFTGGYYQESSIFIGDNYGYKKGSTHINLQHTTANKLSVDLSASYYFDTNKLPRYDLTATAIALSPTAPSLYELEGNLNWENDTWVNPLYYARQTYTGQTWDLLANLMLNYTLTKSMTLKLRGGYTKLDMKETATIPNAAMNPDWQILGSAMSGTSDRETCIVEPYIAYNGEVVQGRLNFILGTTIQKSKENGIVLFADGFANDNELNDLAAAAVVNVLRTHLDRIDYAALFCRLNYQLLDKYFVNLTARRDGEDRDFANYGAIGAGWIFSEEKPGMLSFGKLKASYGHTGSTGTNTNKFESSVDLGFLNNRFQFSATYYLNTSTSDSLESEEVVIRSSGWEVEVNAVNLNRDNFTWTSYLNLTIPRSKLIAYRNVDSSPYALGKSVFVQKKYHFTGVDPESGTYMLQDMDGDGSLTSADLVTTEPLTQTLYGGIGNQIRYKNIELDVFIQVVCQNGFNYMADFKDSPGVSFSNQPTWVMNRWKQPGDVAGVQKFSQDYNGAALQNKNVVVYSDYPIQDASFVRVKNVSLSFHHTKGRFFLQGQNLLTLTAYKGADPETLNSKVLPTLRTVCVGLQLRL